MSADIIKGSKNSDHVFHLSLFSQSSFDDFNLFCLNFSQHFCKMFA